MWSALAEKFRGLTVPASVLYSAVPHSCRLLSVSAPDRWRYTTMVSNLRSASTCAPNASLAPWSKFAYSLKLGMLDALTFSVSRLASITSEKRVNRLRTKAGARRARHTRFHVAASGEPLSLAAQFSSSLVFLDPKYALPGSPSEGSDTSASADLAGQSRSTVWYSSSGRDPSIVPNRKGLSKTRMRPTDSDRSIRSLACSAVVAPGPVS